MWTKNQNRILPSEQSPINWTAFFRGMNHVFPVSLRTKENLDYIVSLAGFYGLNEDEMKKYVWRAIQQNHQVIDFSVLENMLKKNVKTLSPETACPENSWDLSPFVYLQNKSGKNVPLVEREIEVLTKLRDDYEFSDAVINILMDFCLKECSNRITPKYIYAVASTWARAGIETAEQALSRSENDKKSRDKQGNQTEVKGEPDWYGDTGENDEVDPELLAKALSIQAELQAEAEQEEQQRKIESAKQQSDSCFPF